MKLRLVERCKIYIRNPGPVNASSYTFFKCVENTVYRKMLKKLFCLILIFELLTKINIIIRCFLLFSLV